MGFFSSKTEYENTNTYDNPELRKYTEVYRGAAPWGFATLDPTATLAAMGAGTSLGGQDLGVGFKQALEGMSADEKKDAGRTEAALKRIQERQESGQFLTPQETEFINTSLDKAFEYAHKTGYTDWEKATQMLAGSRGLRMSDSPVAEPALRELRNFELGLGSKRAELGLGTTLDFSKNQQLFDAGFAQFQQQLAQNRWGARQGFLFGGGLQAAGNLGYTQTSKGFQEHSPSTMSNISQTMGVLNQGMGLLSKFGSMGAGLGGMGGGGASNYGGMMGMNSSDLGGMFGR